MTDKRKMQRVRRSQAKNSIASQNKKSKSRIPHTLIMQDPFIGPYYLVMKENIKHMQKIVKRKLEEAMGHS